MGQKIILSKDKKKVINVTDKNMTRFWISIYDAVHFVLSYCKIMVGGEIFIPKMPSMKIIDIAKSLAPLNKIKFSGKRPGEKIHEVLINLDEMRYAQKLDDKYVIFNGNQTEEYIKNNALFKSILFQCL